MRRITSRFVLLIATAAVAPLIVYGVVSVHTLLNGTRESVNAGNLNVANQVAQQVDSYMSNNVRVLQSLGVELAATDLASWQQERVLKDYVLAFPEFRELSLSDASGHIISSSSIGNAHARLPDDARAQSGSAYVAPVRVDDDLLPTTTIAIHLARLGNDSGWIVGEIALEQLWRMVDAIHVDSHGYALVVSADGRLIAHGNPDRKGEVASPDQKASPEVLFAGEFRTKRAQSVSYLTDPATGAELLVIAASVQQTGWTVLVEQPTAEAYRTATKLERQLFVAIVLALLGTIVVGYAWGRSFIQRIFALTRVTRSIAEGHLETRVALSGQDEIRELGDAFNSMADKLVELQEDIRKQERVATFGRIAVGLAHDLMHPIQNIGNGCKLIVREWNDPEYREEFRRMFERELATVRRVIEDLKNIARPMPLERFPIDLNHSVSEVVESMQPLARTAGITLRAELSGEPLYIEADLFALGRVYRNLIVNAIQATAPGGLVVAATDGAGDLAQIRIYDTGCGIPQERLLTIFDDFVTTKRRGLGLGLAISRKIVEQLGGTITAASEVGKGTTFVIEFPRTIARPMAQAVG